MPNVAVRTVTGQGQWTTDLDSQGNDVDFGEGSVVLAVNSNSLSAVISLQMKFLKQDGSWTAWSTIRTYDEFPMVPVAFESASNIRYRAGIENGNYTSGSADLILSSKR